MKPQKGTGGGAVQRRVLGLVWHHQLNSTPQEGERWVWWSPCTSSERAACTRLCKSGHLIQRVLLGVHVQQYRLPD